jgi:two-component system, OmpR family, sensor kinase
MPVRSIRFRLLAWYAVVLTVVVGGFAAVLYYEVRAARLAEVDAQLEAAAAGLDSALRLFPPHELNGEAPPFAQPPKKGFEGPKGKFPPPKPKEESGPLRERLVNSLDLPGPPETRPANVYFAIWRGNHSLLKVVGPNPDVQIPSVEPGRPRLAFRGANRELAMIGPEETVILVGRPAGEVARDLRSFAWQLAGTGLAVLAVGLVGGWLIARRIFRPIAAIAATAAKISGDDLSARIKTENIDQELADLARVLNATFRRLEAAFDRQACFTADASHELRTPLAVIRSQAELTLSRARTPEEYEEALRTCLNAAERMTDLVEGLLTLARADAGRETMPREPVDLGRVALDAVDLCRPLAEEKRVRLNTSISTTKVIGDASALSRVVGNLVANAIKYNRPNGQVQITLGPDDGEAVLTVRDTGEGIPEEHHAHLFDRFYRADKARSRATGGSGLGLAIAKAVVEAHGGTIGFESVVGKGSKFWVRLPMTRRKQR